MKSSKNTVSLLMKSLSIGGLALLLLISPCKIRRSIQQVLGIEQTNVSNKSKTTLVNIRPCHTLDSRATQTATKLSSNDTKPFNAEVIAPCGFQALDVRFAFQQRSKAWREIITSIPLYLLYQSLKVYL